MINFDKIRLMFIISTALLFTSCAIQILSKSSGAITLRAGDIKMDEAIIMAEKHCKQHGKSAVFIRSEHIRRYFECK